MSDRSVAIKESFIKLSKAEQLELVHTFIQILANHSIGKDKASNAAEKEKQLIFDAVELDTRGYSFDRDIANER